MTSSNTSVTALSKSDNVASPHEKVEGKVKVVPWRNIDNIGPAGSINSNVTDMAQWVRLHLGDGKRDKKQLLSSGTVDYYELGTRDAMKEIWKIKSMWYGLASITVAQLITNALAFWAIEYFKRVHHLSNAGAGGVGALLLISSVAGFVVSSTHVTPDLGSAHATVPVDP